MNIDLLDTDEGKDIKLKFSYYSWVKINYNKDRGGKKIIEWQNFSSCTFSLSTSRATF